MARSSASPAKPKGEPSGASPTPSPPPTTADARSARSTEATSTRATLAGGWSIEVTCSLFKDSTERARFAKDPERYANIDLADRGSCPHCWGWTSLARRPTARFSASVTFDGPTFPPPDLGRGPPRPLDHPPTMNPFDDRGRPFSRGGPVSEPDGPGVT